MPFYAETKDSEKHCFSRLEARVCAPQSKVNTKQQNVSETTIFKFLKVFQSNQWFL